MKTLIAVAILLIAVTASESTRHGYFSAAQAVGLAKRITANRVTAVEPVYGEFIRPFTFEGGPQLPIVQPGGSLIFPVPTVPPAGVTYVEDSPGLLVPRGTYRVAWVLNPSENASVTLLVNGVAPTTVGTAAPYTHAVASGVVNFEYLVRAPLNENVISLVNTGSTLFTLNDIPNTKLGGTSIITQIRVLRLGDG